MITLWIAAMLLGTREPETPRIELERPWVRLLPPSAEVTAAYVTFRNEYAEPDTLLSASTDAAASTELHVMTEVDGVMTMREVAFMVVPAHGVLELAPGGPHLMLMGLTRPLSPDHPVRIDLMFSREGRVPLVAPVVDLRRSKPESR